MLSLPWLDGFSGLLPMGASLLFRRTIFRYQCLSSQLSVLLFVQQASKCDGIAHQGQVLAAEWNQLGQDAVCRLNDGHHGMD